jgi:hypothetical protein
VSSLPGLGLAMMMSTVLSFLGRGLCLMALLSFSRLALVLMPLLLFGVGLMLASFLVSAHLLAALGHRARDGWLLRGIDAA